MASGSSFTETNGDFSGQVRIFDCDGNEWQQPGANIDGMSKTGQEVPLV